MISVRNYQNKEQEVHDMKQVKTVEVKTVAQVKFGTIGVFDSQASHETICVEVSRGVLDEIFVPKQQTHQVSVVRGKVVLVVWQGQKHQDIHLEETLNQVVIIPSDVRYGFINLHKEPSVVVNAVLHDKGSDYQFEHYPVNKSITYEGVIVEQPTVKHHRKVGSKVFHTSL